MSHDLRISIDDALRALAAAPYDYVELFKRGDFSALQSTAVRSIRKS